MSEDSVLEQKIDQIHESIDTKQWGLVRTLLNDLHPADIAGIIRNASDKSRAAIFALLPDEENQGDVLSELDDETREALLDSLTPDVISHIVEEMAPDDAADLIGDLDKIRGEAVLRLMDADDSEDVRELLSYEEDSAGGIMNSDFVALTTAITAQQALNHISNLELDEPLHFVYVIDEDQRLCGYVQLWKLLKSGNRYRDLEELVDTDIFFAHTDTDQEEVARMMSKYDLSSLPVLDTEGCLVGRITIDDIIDVLEDEATEDIFKLAGSSEEELEYTSPIQAGKARLPWLLITLATGLLTSMILRGFMESITALEVIALSFFVPIVMAMGGNTGIQSSTLVIRGLALDAFNTRKLYQIFLREILTGMLMGGICGLVIAAWARIMIGQSTAYPPAFLALCIGIAMCAAMIFAAAFGALVPLALNRFKLDPAVASGPFVTASNDIVALIIYYLTTVLMLNAIA